MKKLFTILFLFIACKVSAQTLGTFPIAGLVLSNTTASVTASNAILGPLTLGAKAISILPTFACANAGTSNVVFNFDVSADGTTYTTTLPITVTVAANGTNTVTDMKSITAASMANMSYLRLTSVTTTITNNVTVSKVQYAINP